MIKSQTIIRSAAAVSLAAFAYAAFAAPYGCVYGYEDNTCLQPIRSAPQVAPVCSSAPGWTTIAAAQWQGSHYSAPQCNYQAPPTCPTGSTTIGAPAWNGLSWGAPGCVTNKPTPGNNLPSHNGAALVAVTPIFVSVNCGIYFPTQSGTTSALLYQANYADGYVSYYQMASPTVAYSASVDSLGRYYVDVFGDNWDGTRVDPSNGGPLPSLYLGYADPNYPPSSWPASQCYHEVGSAGH